MSKGMPKKEEPLYEPIRRALERVFSCLGECHLEITADKRFSDKLKKQFSKDTLYIIRVEGFFPDLTGFVKTQYGSELITVEIKPENITIKDIFQAKEQAEMFDAKYALLVSPKTTPEEIRRFVKDRSSILNFLYNRRVVIAQFNEPTEEFETGIELYYGSLPEPFQSHEKAIEAEQLVIDSVGFGIKPERRVDVSVSNKGTVAVEIIEARINYLPISLSTVLTPGARSFVELAKEWAPDREYKIELITKNGKKFSFVARAPEEKEE